MHCVPLASEKGSAPPRAADAFPHSSSAAARDALAAVGSVPNSLSPPQRTPRTPVNRMGGKAGTGPSSGEAAASVPAARPHSSGAGRNALIAITAAVTPPSTATNAQGHTRLAGGMPTTPRTPYVQQATTPRSGVDPRSLVSPTAGARGPGGSAAAGVGPSPHSTSPGRPQLLRTTSNPRRRLCTRSPAAPKAENSCKNGDGNEAASSSINAATASTTATAAAPPSGPASVVLAPKHLQQLQAPPKKKSQVGKGLKMSRGIRKEAIGAGSGGNATASASGSLVALISSSSRSMAPIVHVRMRPLLPFLGETNEKRKVWFLDHENIVVRAPTGTVQNSVSAAVAGANTGSSGAAGGGGGGAGGGGSGGRRPTLTASKSKGARGHRQPQSNANASPLPPHHHHQLQQHTRSHSSPSLESLPALPTAKNPCGDSAETPPHVAFGATTGHSRSMSEQSALSDQAGSDHTSAGRLSSSSPPPLLLMQPSPSSSATSTPRPPLKVRGCSFPEAQGNRASVVAHSQRTTPSQEPLANTISSARSFFNKPHRYGRMNSPAGAAVSAGTKAGTSKRRDLRFRDTFTTAPNAAGGGGGAGEAADVGVGNEQHFTFEFVHDERATQEEVFEDSVLRFADEALLAQNVTILCYGPTGSGKTFSMMGNTSSHGGPAANGVSRRASMATGLYHGNAVSPGLGASQSPSKSGAPRLRQPSLGGAGGAGGGGAAAGDAAETNANKACGSECLEDSIAQVSEEDTEDDEWPLFDHTWYRDRQRRAMLMDKAHASDAFGRAAADNMRTTEMGILPRLVRVLLDRRSESVTLNTIDTAGSVAAQNTPGATPAAGGGPPSSSVTAQERSASASSSTTAGTSRRGAAAPQQQPPPPPQSNWRRKGQGPPTRRTISLALRELTFYGIELYCDELSDLMDPGKRPINNVSDTGGLTTMCTRLNQSREDAVRAATAAASSGNRAAAAARANTGGGLPIESLEDLRKAYRLARRNRVTAPHAHNERSSRSHAVFVLQLRFELSQRTTNTSTGEVLYESAQPMDSYVAMVDLAGSERLKESQVESGQALREAQYINKSLSALSSVVLSLYKRSSHIPYRDSKLTRMLRPCLEGGRVLILVHVAPCSGANTLNTLKFADQIRHTMVQTHNFAHDANKRGLMDIFEDLIDPEQAKKEVAYAHTLERYEQLCAEVRLAFLSSNMLLEGTGGAVPRNSGSCSAFLENSATLTMSRVSSSRGSLDGGGDAEEGEDRAQRPSVSSPSVPRDDAAGVPYSALPSNASLTAARAFRVRSLASRHYAPLKASEDAGVQEAIRDIALERDRRVEAAKRKIDIELLNLKAAIDEVARLNAQLARENASPLPDDPYCQELSKLVRTTTEEVKEMQSHNTALQSCVNVLRQRVAAQEDIMAAVSADVEEMKSKGLLPVAPSPFLQGAASADRSYYSYFAGSRSTPQPCSPPPASSSSSPAQTPPPPTLFAANSSLTYMDNEVATDAEMREIGYQQVLLSQELSALRLEAACYGVGDGIWEGLWARAVRQELLTAVKVEVALMESVLLDCDVLKSLAASARAVVLPPGGDARQGQGTPSPVEDTLAIPSLPSAASGAARGKASLGSGRKALRNGNGNGNGKSNTDSGNTASSNLQQISAEALAYVETYLEEQSGSGAAEDAKACFSDPKEPCHTAGGRASGEQANRDTDDHGNPKAGIVGSAASTPGSSGLPPSATGTGAPPALVDIPNPLEVLFYKHEDGVSGNTNDSAPTNSPGPAGLVPRSTEALPLTTAVHTASRRSSVVESIAAAYSSVSLVGSYHDEEKLQRASVLKLLTDGVVCEAVCIGDDFEAVMGTFLAPSSATNEGDVNHGDGRGDANGDNNGGAGEGAELGGPDASWDRVNRSLGSHPLLGSSQGNTSIGVDHCERKQRGSAAQLSMTKHYGRLRLVRKAAKGGAAGTRRLLALPGVSSQASPADDMWIPGEEGAAYCLEFVYSHHGIPLQPRLADAIAAAATPSPKTQLEELVDSLPSPADVRRAYTPASGNSKTLSPSAAALLKERRLFSVPLNEPQLAVDLHLLEAGVVTGGASAGHSVGTSSPPATGRSSPTLSVSETPRVLHTVDGASVQVALELHGIPLSNAKPRCQPGNRLSLYQQCVCGSGGAVGDDLAASTSASSVSASPIGRDVVMAKRLKEGGELLLPSPCILPNKGTCTLLLRLPRGTTANATRVESVEAIVAALCGVMPPMMSTTTSLAPTPTPPSPSKAAAERAAHSRSPPRAALDAPEALQANEGSGGSVACVYPHIPYVLLSPSPSLPPPPLLPEAATAAEASRTEQGGEAKGESGDQRVGSSSAPPPDGRAPSPDPRRPTGGSSKAPCGSRPTNSINVSKGRGRTSGGGGGSRGSLADSTAPIRGTALRVHLHFPGSLSDNVVDLAAIAADGISELGPIRQSIVRAAMMLQGLRFITIGPFMSDRFDRNGDGVADSRPPEDPSSPVSPVSSSPAGEGRSGWRVAQRLEQLHAFRRNIRSLIKQQIYEAEDIKENTVPNAGGICCGTSGVSSGLVREVAAEAREAVGLSLGNYNGADSTLASPYSTNHSIGSLLNTSGRGPHLLPQPYGDVGQGSEAKPVGTVKGEVSLAQARELGGAALPWTLWHWAYRWPSIASLCAQLERAALTTATATPTATATATTAAAGLNSPQQDKEGDGDGDVGTLSLQHFLQGVFAPVDSLRGSGVGWPMLSASPFGSPLGGAVGGPATEGNLSVMWSAVPDGSPIFEPIVIPSGSDEDDMFSSFGHGNWMAESAAMSTGAAAQKKVWLPELTLAPVPAFLSSLTVGPSAVGSQRLP